MTHERYALTIRSEPGFRGDMKARLKAFLKTALRLYGLRVVEIRPVDEPETTDTSGDWSLIGQGGR